MLARANTLLRERLIGIRDSIDALPDDEFRSILKLFILVPIPACVIVYILICSIIESAYLISPEHPVYATLCVAGVGILCFFSIGAFCIGMDWCIDKLLDWCMGSRGKNVVDTPEQDIYREII